MAGEADPRWLKGLKPEDVGRISEAVRLAESKSSIEIVPMIVRRSSVIGQVPIVLTLILAVIALLTVLALRNDVHDGLVMIFALLSLPVSAFTAIPLSGFHWVQRLLIPDFEEELQVQRRATAEFAFHQIDATRERTGLLLFVSVMERRAVVLPDEGLKDVLTPEVCERLVLLMATHLHKGRWGDAFAAVISEAGDLAAGKLPRAASNDELGNGLIIKE